MADREGAVRAALLADTAVVEYVDDRIWFGELPQQQTDVEYTPAVIVAGDDDTETTYTMGSTGGLVRGSTQVECWAKDRAACQGLRDVVVDALRTYDSTVDDVRIAVVGLIVGDPKRDSVQELWGAIQIVELWGTE